MTTFLSKEVVQGIQEAKRRSLRRSNRLRVRADDQMIKVLKYWRNGFTLEAKQGQVLRGLVDLYDGSKHLYQCLIMASKIDGTQVHYEFKRSTLTAPKAPVDFERDSNAPIALIEAPRF